MGRDVKVRNGARCQRTYSRVGRPTLPEMADVNGRKPIKSWYRRLPMSINRALDSPEIIIKTGISSIMVTNNANRRSGIAATENGIGKLIGFWSHISGSFHSVIFISVGNGKIRDNANKRSQPFPHHAERHQENATDTSFSSSSCVADTRTGRTINNKQATTTR